jgi:FecR protein
MMSHRWIVSLALTPLLGLPAFAQSVISAHSGVIHFSDGSVFLDDQRVEQKTGKFDQMNNGSELRTQDGRAEVLLTPGTFLRMGANSAIRMVSNQLDDTRVELLSGSAILDQGSDTLAGTAVTILYNLDQVQIKKAGRYRFDSEPPQVKVESGAVAVIADGKSVEAGPGYVVPFEGKLTARKLLNDSQADDPALSKPGDNLDHWDEARNNSVAESNTDAAATSDLSRTIDGWQNDPDAVLQSLGIPPYIPGMSSMVPPPGYGSPYGSGLYGGYGSGLYGSGLYGSGLYGNGLYGSLYGPGLYGYGFTAYSPLLVYGYGMPLYRPYGANPPSYVYRGLTNIPGRVGYGYGTRSLGTVRPGVGVGVGRPMMGGVHVGGHR